MKDTYSKLKIRNKSFYNSKACLNSSFKNSDGLTLVELVITLTILAIVTSIAAPSIIGQLASMEAKRVRYEIMGTLKMAKAESLIQRRNLTVCLTDALGNCSKDGSENLILFLDRNNNNRYDAETDTLFSQQQINAKYGTVHLAAALQRDHIKFLGSSGHPRGYNGHIKYCPKNSNANVMYQVSFNNVGIIKHRPNSSRYPTGCL